MMSIGFDGSVRWFEQQGNSLIPRAREQTIFARR
jgi:hypothetical protein